MSDDELVIYKSKRDNPVYIKKRIMDFHKQKDRVERETKALYDMVEHLKLWVSDGRQKQIATIAPKGEIARMAYYRDIRNYNLGIRELMQKIKDYADGIWFTIALYITTGLLSFLISVGSAG